MTCMELLSNQGLDQYIKRVHAFCYDCQPTVMRPPSWYFERHMAAGFANSRKNRKECNCDFVVVGDQVFLKARRFISKGEELFVFYKFRT